MTVACFIEWVHSFDTARKIQKLKLKSEWRIRNV